MATVGENVFTISDWGKRLDPEGKIDTITDVLAATNDILKDALFQEGNLPTGHRTTVRTGLPSVTWRKLNYGVQPSKSKTKQVDDTCGMLEAYAEVDRDLADLNGEDTSFRLSEDRAFIEAMNQEMANTLIYGDTDVNPERFLGLSPRYGYLDSPNVIDAGGSGSECTSIWLVVWGPDTVHMTFPKGSQAGIQHKDLGEVTLEDDNGGMYQGYRTHYQWKSGFVVRDWRYVVRIANIDTTNMPTDLPKLYIEALNLIPNLAKGRPAFYMNKDVKTQMDILAMDKSNALVQVSKDMWGQPQYEFQGYPMRKVDAIKNNEDALVNS